jgi:gas vesicle protein
MNNGYSGGQLFLAFLGGAAIGAVAGLLTAPASGEELRNRVLESARKRKDEIGRLPGAVKAAYTQAADAARNAFVESYTAQGDGTTK